MNLDDLRALARVDPHDARGALAGFPDQCRRARTLVASPPLSTRRPRVIVVAAMGGSAAGGDLLAACAADSVDVPIIVHRGYGLPPVAGPEALVIASSYSGETAEVLSAFEVAVARGVPVVALTSGGTLARRGAEAGRPHVALPGGLMPRMALGYLFFPLLTIVAAAGLPTVPPEEVAEALEIVEAVGAALGPAQQTPHNEAKRLALAVGDRMPIIYGGQITACPAYRWKTDVEENAKRFAVAGALPEMNHNELEAWRAPEAGRLQAIFLRDPGEHPDIDRRFAILRTMIEPAAGGVSEVWSRGEGRLARLVYTSLYRMHLLAIHGWLKGLTLLAIGRVNRIIRPRLKLH